MRQAPSSSTRPDVWDRVASKLREVVRHEHINSLSGAERFTVKLTAPLTIEAMDSDLLLTDGDPDVTVSAPLRAYIAAHPLALGDCVWVLRENQLWHVVDVAG